MIELDRHRHGRTRPQDRVGVLLDMRKMLRTDIPSTLRVMEYGTRNGEYRGIAGALSPAEEAMPCRTRLKH
jgi:hypothetical protein